MPGARGSLLVLVGPRNSHHNLQGNVLILWERSSGAFRTYISGGTCALNVYRVEGRVSKNVPAEDATWASEHVVGKHFQK